MSLLAAALLATGCVVDASGIDTKVVDRCEQQRLFYYCLAHTAAWPQLTVISDWAEVVKECGTQAARMSKEIPSRKHPETCPPQPAP